MSSAGKDKTHVNTTLLSSRVISFIDTCEDASVLARMLSKLDIVTLKHILKQHIAQCCGGGGRGGLGTLQRIHRVANPLHHVSTDILAYILHYLFVDEACVLAVVSKTFAKACMFTCSHHTHTHTHTYTNDQPLFE